MQHLGSKLRICDGHLLLEVWILQTQQPSLKIVGAGQAWVALSKRGLKVMSSGPLKQLHSPQQKVRAWKVHLEGWGTNMLGRHGAGLCVMHSAQVSLSRGSQRCLCCGCQDSSILLHKHVVGLWVLLGSLVLTALHTAGAALWIEGWSWLAVISDGQQLDVRWGAWRLKATGCLRQGLWGRHVGLVCWSFGHIPAGTCSTC